MPATVCTVHRFGLTSYDDGLDLQRRFASDVRERGAAHLLLLQHEPTYTLGARVRTEHLLADEALLAQLGAVIRHSDRGGDITFHGPGQLVGYPILDLREWSQGPRWYVRSLEQVLIETLARFGIDSERSAGRPGVWVDGKKIASIGVRISRGITTHGFALNVDTDLDYFAHIIPCGLPDITVTSMAQVLGIAPRMEAVMDAVASAFDRVFEIEVRETEGALVG
jgi:lipoyl(octanoyl) transferase